MKTGEWKQKLYAVLVTPGASAGVKCRQGSLGVVLLTDMPVPLWGAEVKQLPSYRTRSATLPRSEPLPTTTTGHYTICCKKSLILALLKMGKSLPETC